MIQQLPLKTICGIHCLLQTALLHTRNYRPFENIRSNQNKHGGWFWQVCFTCSDITLTVQCQVVSWPVLCRCVHLVSAYTGRPSEIAEMKIHRTLILFAVFLSACNLFPLIERRREIDGNTYLYIPIHIYMPIYTHLYKNNNHQLIHQNTYNIDS